MHPTWLAVGLGNPGRGYERTRHNAGARAVGRLAGELGAKLKRSKSPALLADIPLEGARLLLARPTSYMNESGEALVPVLRWFSIEPDRLIVVHDEIDISANTLRLKRGGGTAGHNGLESLVRALRTPDFYRVRIGVGRPPGRKDPARWVLDKMSKAEAAQLAVAEAEAGDAVLAIVREGLERAMNRFNTR